MELQHFGHEHPLEFKSEGMFEEEEKEKLPSYNCYMCRKSISLPAYFCRQCDCTCLHETCAKLADQEILHPMHSAHPLKFTTLAQSLRRCDACWQDFSGFSYSCPKCNLDINTPSYMCTTCSFWIHEECASLPTIKGLEDHDHDHPLTLAYQLPLEFRRYNFECEFCRKVLKPSEWVYYCGRCRYFVHVYCLSIHVRFGSRIDYDHNDADAGPNDLRLPCNDVFDEMIKPVMEKRMKEELKLLPEIKHFSHSHPLILSSTQPVENEKDTEEMLCDGCIQPISTPYYTCAECKYMLHLTCANFSPERLYHVCCYGHLLTLKKFRNELGMPYQNPFNCVIFSFGKQMVYKLHKQHILWHARSYRQSPSMHCHACREEITSSNAYYRCRCGFFLHQWCATLPGAVKHRWDKHPILLMHPPFSDHSDELYCEVCEDEIHPKTWIYHCRECDQSFHPRCIPRLGKDGNVKFGSTIQVANHEHPLRSVRKSRYKSSCNGCGTKFNGGKAWEFPSL
ncbi:uncharacterized protein [Coffea arabica]|uniref:Zinc finger PHD-type domain-containing protein n=1 Tax=Coffea arabica TaxID=13443 RepID=A0ABM4WQ86_COFAR